MVVWRSVAVVTGIQIHNWAEEFDGAEPNLEFVAPTSVYAVVDGQRVDLDLTRVPVRVLFWLAGRAYWMRQHCFTCHCCGKQAHNVQLGGHIQRAAGHLMADYLPTSLQE